MPEAGAVETQSSKQPSSVYSPSYGDFTYYLCTVVASWADFTSNWGTKRLVVMLLLYTCNLECHVKTRSLTQIVHHNYFLLCVCLLELFDLFVALKLSYSPFQVVFWSSSNCVLGEIGIITCNIPIGHLTFVVPDCVIQLTDSLFI